MDKSDLTTDMQEMLAEMAAMRAELNGLKERAQALPQPSLPTTPALTTTRRKTLKRLGLALLGGAAAATAVGGIPAQAKTSVNPPGTNNQVGAFIVPPGKPVPTGIPPNNAVYGLVGTDGSSLNLDLLPSYINYATGVLGYAGTTWGNGVTGNAATPSGYGVYGYSPAATAGYGVGGRATGTNSYGVVGSTNGVGSYAVFGYAAGTNSYGVVGNATDTASYAVYGSASATNSYGVYGRAAGTGSYGVYGLTTGASSKAVYGRAATGTNSYAGYFDGNVYLSGTINGAANAFTIDHPLDPANKYLYHSSVESPDMMNIYNGIVTLDHQGEAIVEMPGWFEGLNSDYRYQLTSIGISMPDLFIAEKLANRKFKIAGGKPGQEVSWMVTGIRQDAYAKAYRSPVEQDKTGDEKGKYIHPELFGQPAEMSVGPRPVVAK